MYAPADAGPEGYHTSCNPMHCIALDAGASLAQKEHIM
jgi:hypothetical protein